METWDAIRSRRNVRAYTDRPIPPEDLDRILEAGRRSPSSRNGQPWELVVVTDRDQLERLSQVWRSAGHVAVAAAAVALVMPATEDRDTRDWHAFDLGQAAMSLMLAAADLGIGSCHSSIGDQALARSILGVPDDREVFAILSLGYPADRPLAVVHEPDRRAFDDVVRRGRWGPAEPGRP